MKILNGNKRFLSIFACLTLLCLAFSMTQIMGVGAHAASSSTNYSFATYTQSAAQYLNQMSKPGQENNGGKVNEVPSNLNFGAAGALLGYLDNEAINKDSIFIFVGTESYNAVSYDYRALAGIQTGGRAAIRIDMPGIHITVPGTGSSGHINRGFSQYAYFGRTLSLMGFDETSMSGNSQATRQVIGLITLAAYILSYGLSAFFKMIISILSLASPFRLFSKAVTIKNHSELAASSLSAGAAGGSVSTAINTGVGILVDYVSSMYDVIHGLSLYVILPITLAITVFIWLIVRKGGNFWSTWKGFFVKLTFAIIGVPLMFMCYDASLDWVKDALVAKQINGTKIVTSTFCDFEAWVGKNRLKLPASTTFEYDSKEDALKDSTISKTRYYCSKINDESGAINDVIRSDDATMSKYEGYDTYMLNQTSMSATASDDFSEVINMLQRYSRGDFVSASAFEAASKAVLNQDDSKAYIAMCQLSTQWQYFDDDKATKVPLEDNAGGAVDLQELDETYVQDWASKRWSQSTWQQGSATPVVNIWFDGGGNNCSLSGDTFTYAGTGGGANGLTTLSMYNYLNTDFSSNHATVYSAVNSTNDKVKMQHYSVNLVGSGLMQLIYWLDALALMTCMAILGYGYGFALMIGNFKAIFRMIPAVVTGMVGSMRGIATALALTAALIVEVLATFLLYSIACDVIVVCYKIVELPLAELLRNNLGTLAGVAAGMSTIITPLLGVVSIFIICSITKKLLEWRHAVVQSTVDACTHFINKFLGTQIGAPNLDGSLGSTLQNVAAIGTGLAMGASAIGLTDSESFQNMKDKATGALTDAKDGILSDEGRESMENAFGVKTGNGTGEDENGLLAESGEVDSISGLADGEGDERGINSDAAVDEYLSNNSESALFGDADGAIPSSESKKPSADLSGRKLTKAEAKGVHKTSDGSLVDSDGNEVLKNADGSYSYAENPELRAGRSLTDDEAAGVHTDASGKLVDSSGNSVVKNADGSYSYEDKAGRELTSGEVSGLRTDADGQLVDAEGNAVVQNDDGSYSYAGHSADYRGGFVDANGNSVTKNADGTFSDSAGNSVDAREVYDSAGNSVATSSVGDYNYMKETGLDDAGAMEAYMDADLADDGQLNHSADASAVAQEYESQQVLRNSRGGGYSRAYGSKSGSVNARPIASPEYQNQYDNAYADADFADDGEFNGSVQATGKDSMGRQTVRAGARNSMSQAYQQNYSAEYADADFADDGQYNGSVQVTGTNARGQFVGNSRQASAPYMQNHDEAYMQADLTDDGQYNGSVAGVVNKSTGKTTVNTSAGPSQAYQQNYSTEYATADFADDGQYNGSVSVGGKNSSGQYVVRKEATQTYINTTTDEYAAADFADDGSYNGSVDYVMTDSGKRTVSMNARPSANYKANHDVVYEQADFADDGQYNGSVAGTVNVDTGKTTVNVASGPSQTYQQNYSTEYANADFADDGQYNGSVLGTVAKNTTNNRTVIVPVVSNSGVSPTTVDMVSGNVNGANQTVIMPGAGNANQSQRVVVLPGQGNASNQQNVVYVSQPGANVQTGSTIVQSVSANNNAVSGGGVNYDYGDGNDYSQNVHGTSVKTNNSANRTRKESSTTYKTNNQSQNNYGGAFGNSRQAQTFTNQSNGTTKAGYEGHASGEEEVVYSTADYADMHNGKSSNDDKNNNDNK